MNVVRKSSGKLLERWLKRLILPVKTSYVVIEGYRNNKEKKEKVKNL